MQHYKINNFFIELILLHDFFSINVEDVKECCCVKIILVYYIDQELFKQSC